MTVRLPQVLHPLTERKRDIELRGETVGDVLSALAETFPDIRWQLFCGEKELNAEPLALNRYVNVYYCDQDVRVLDGLETATEDGSTITILPAYSGG